MNSRLIHRKLPVIFFFVVIFIQSCTSVRLISDYDEVTDKTATAMQEKVTAFFVKLERNILTDSAAASYENNLDFYTDVKVDLATLKIRADAVSNNRIVQNQVQALTEMVNSLEQLHKIGFISVEQVTPLIQPFNSAFTAIAKLQLALKRGEN